MISFISSFKPLFLAAFIILLIEGGQWLFVDVPKTYRTNMLEFAAYKKENEQRLQLDYKINEILDRDTDVIVVGESSGFYGVNPVIIEKLLPGYSVANLACCADSGIDGERFVAQHALNKTTSPKVVILHVSPHLIWRYMRVNRPLGDLLYDNFVRPWANFIPPSSSWRSFITNFVYYGAPHHGPYYSPPSSKWMGVYRDWDQLAHVLKVNKGWVPHPRKRPVQVKACQFNRADPKDAGFFEHNNYKLLLDELEEYWKIANDKGARFMLVFNPVTCDPGDGAGLAQLNEVLKDLTARHPDIIIPFTLVTQWDSEKFHDPVHLGPEGSVEHSRRIAQALANVLEGGGERHGN